MAAVSDCKIKRFVCRFVVGRLSSALQFVMVSVTLFVKNCHLVENEMVVSPMTIEKLDL